MNVYGLYILLLCLQNSDDTSRHEDHQVLIRKSGGGGVAVPAWWGEGGGAGLRLGHPGSVPITAPRLTFCRSPSIRGAARPGPWTLRPCGEVIRRVSPRTFHVFGRWRLAIGVFVTCQLPLQKLCGDDPRHPGPVSGSFLCHSRLRPAGDSRSPSPSSSLRQVTSQCGLAGWLAECRAGTHG